MSSIRFESRPTHRLSRQGLIFIFRDGLEALISRSAFYDLICLADEYQLDGKILFYY